MRTLFYLVALGVVIAAGIWAVQRVRWGSSVPVVGRSPVPLPPSDGHVSEPASIAYGPDRGPGTLQLSPTQLVFTGGSGRVVAIERIDVVGVSTTTQLPDRTVAQPMLVVATNETVHYFAVQSPAPWEARLL